jgi:hypothetical protein
MSRHGLASPSKKAVVKVNKPFEAAVPRCSRYEA